MHIKRADYWNVGPFGILGSDEFAIIIEVFSAYKSRTPSNTKQFCA